MAFVTIIASRFAVGKAIVKLLFTDIIGDLDDLDSRLSVVEAGANKIQIFNERNLVRKAASLTDWDDWQAPSPFTILDAKLSIYIKGSATGTLEYDILKGSDNDISTAVSIFTTKPVLVMAAASDYEENTGTLDATKITVATGERLFLSITSIPTGLGIFRVFVVGEFN